MRYLLWIAICAGIAAGQSPTGSIEGVVLDSVTRAPVKRAAIETWRPLAQPPPSAQIGVQSFSGMQSMAQNTARTDSNGSFVFRDLPPGSYPLNATHPRYQQARGPVSKTVEVKAGETTRVTFELTPGGTITGRVVDEDGDPLPGCMPQLLPARRMDPVMMSGSEASDAKGVFSIWGVAPGRFKLLIRCTSPVLEPFPLQPITQPRLPTVAYPPTFYPGVKQIEQAQVIEVSPGLEKTGIDLQVKPARVFTIRGTLRSPGADLSKVNVSLMPRDPAERDGMGMHGAAIDPAKGTFTAEAVFPGSYTLLAFTNQENDKRGVRQQVDVPSTTPVDLELKPGVEVSGKIEVDGEFKSPLNSIAVYLTETEPMGLGPVMSKTADDGTFTIRGLVPGVYRLQSSAPGLLFIKSMSWNGQDLPDDTLDTTGGGAGPLRILVSTKTATIKGTAPANRVVEAVSISAPNPMRSAAMTDMQGAFTLGGLRPGKYRVSLGGTDTGEDAGEEVAVVEGETATVTVREPSSR